MQAEGPIEDVADAFEDAAEETKSFEDAFRDLVATITGPGDALNDAQLLIQDVNDVIAEERLSVDLMVGKNSAPLPEGVSPVEVFMSVGALTDLKTSSGETWRPWRVDFSTYEIENPLFSCIILNVSGFFRISPPPENLPRAVMEALTELKTPLGRHGVYV